MIRTILLRATIFALLPATAAHAQDVALKTNLLSDGFLNVNAGMEASIGTHWSVELTGDLNCWNLSHGRKWKHWLVQPEARYWFCEALGGHFAGVHALIGQYNAGHIDLPFSLPATDFSALKTRRYQGWAGGLGLTYGYSWLLSRHWNLEAELGLGWVYTRFDRFECAGCGRRTGKGKHNYVGPTKAAVNLVYLF